MFSIAYRMTGSVSDAEDIVQEAFLRLSRVLRDGTSIDSPKAYVGAWLPEPLVTDTDPGPAERAQMSDSLSVAFLVLLESLTPTERAVFLLHEVFGYDYTEIADITGKSEPNCRQILARARHVQEGRPRFEASREQRDEVGRQPGAVAYDAEGRVVSVFALDIADGLVHTVRSVVNPDKLQHLGPTSDLYLRGRPAGPPVASPAGRDLPWRSWPPTSPKRPRPTRSSTASRRPPTRGCASC